MEQFVYFAKVSLYAAIMWSIYMAVWRNSSLHRYSRVYLLLSMILPVVLPLVHIVAAGQSPIAAHAVSLPLVTASPEQNGTVGNFNSPVVFRYAYLFISMFIALVYARNYYGIYSRLRNAPSKVYNGYRVYTNTGIGPGSMGRNIFFPSAHIDEVIARHEQAHINSLHRYDSLLLQMTHIFFWMSPAHWFLGRELKMVHEFEADRTACSSADTEAYVSLLLSQTFGKTVSLNITHSFFHHPLKRRVMMLQKSTTSSSGWLLFATSLLTAAFTTTVVLAQVQSPTETSLIPDPDTTGSISQNATPYTQIRVQEGEVRLLPAGGFAYVRVRQMPHFNGDLTAWVKNNLRYPEEARALKLSGLCTIQFTVDQNGSIINPHVLQSSQHAVLDAEALRLIRSMPQWQPGYHAEHAVPVLFSQSIFFNADGKTGVQEGC